MSDDLKRFKEDVEARMAATKKVVSESTVGRVSRRTIQFTMAFDWMTEKAGPVWRVVTWPFRKAWMGYFWIWDRVVYVERPKVLVHPQQFRVKRFSRPRAGAFLFASLCFAWFLLFPILWFTLELGLYLSTAKRNESVYLFNAQEIDREDNVHSVQGCYRLPCGDEDSIYFRIETTAFKELWSLTHRGTLFYSDYVAAAVPVTISECVITSYGFRFKLFMRGFDVYPYLLESTCTPVKS